MKTLIRSLVLATSFMLLFALPSCDKETDYRLQLNFYYKNSSDRAIHVRHYKSSELVESFMLTPQSSVLFLNLDTEGDKNHQPADFDKFFQHNPVIDSVYIVFDSERLQPYTLNDGKTRSVLDVANYESSEKEKNDFEFVYEFTGADFEGAEELK